MLNPYPEIHEKLEVIRTSIIVVDNESHRDWEGREAQI